MKKMLQNCLGATLVTLPLFWVACSAGTDVGTEGDESALNVPSVEGDTVAPLANEAVSNEAANEAASNEAASNEGGASQLGRSEQALQASGECCGEPADVVCNATGESYPFETCNLLQQRQASAACNADCSEPCRSRVSC